MNTGNIPIELLYKKIENRLSETEEFTVREWLKTPGHLRYFENLQHFYSLPENSGVTDDELRTEWAIMKGKVIGQRREIERRRILSMMSIVASLILIIGFFWIFNDPLSKKVVTEKIVQIHPGKYNAILELADGSIYDLRSLSQWQKNKMAENLVVDSCRLGYVKSDTLPPQVLSYNKLSVPRGGEFQILLEDGTKVWLNSESSLRYPEIFGKTSREVFLEGEAYFEVAKNQDCPFIVYSGVQKVTVLGTSFGITNYSDGAGLSTTLVTGKVTVEYSDATDRRYELEPGFRICYDFKQQSVLCEPVDVREYVAWKDGKYIFTRKRLEDMLATLSRWYDFQVFYQNAEVKEVLFSGELMRFENFNAILRMIEKSSDVKFKIDGHVVVVAK